MSKIQHFPVRLIRWWKGLFWELDYRGIVESITKKWQDKLPYFKTSGPRIFFKFFVLISLYSKSQKSSSIHPLPKFEVNGGGIEVFILMKSCLSGTCKARKVRCTPFNFASHLFLLICVISCLITISSYLISNWIFNTTEGDRNPIL